MQVYSYCVTLLKNTDAAEEAAQETFFRAMNTSSKFEGRSDELTWLCAIAKNICTDFFRQRKRYAEMPDESMISGDDDASERAEKRDTALRLHMILHSLEEPYKEVFSLRVFGELSFSDIGSIFGKSENWARVTFHRARLRIKERMDENGEE